MNNSKAILIAAFAFLFFSSFVQATETRVAYIVEDSTFSSAKHQVLYGILDELNLQRTTIKDSQIPSIDFSQYSLIIVADDVDNSHLLNLPQKNAIFFHRGIASEVWSFQSSGESTTKKDIKAYNASSFAFNEVILPDSKLINIYTGIGGNVHYLTPPLFQSDIKVDAMRDDGPAIFRPIIAHSTRFNNGTFSKSLFLGLPEFSKWTPDAKQIFRNSVVWLAEEIDQDNDGFAYSQDCNDNNPGINPNAVEIPYDGIDQNCDGVDLLDADSDGFCKQGSQILSTTLQCPLESGIFGTDCDDSDFEINTNNLDTAFNCVNDAPVIYNIVYENSYSEGEEISIEVQASDPENDNLSYSINNPNFTEQGNTLVWQSDFNSAGIYLLTVIVSDGQLSTTEEIAFVIDDVNRGPVFNDEFSAIYLDEDSLISFNLSDIASDSDGDTLTFSLDGVSLNENLDLTLSETSLTVSSTNNFNGVAGSLAISVSDGVNNPISKEIPVVVSPVNDAPVLFAQIPQINIEEDTGSQEVLDLNEYFQDVDSPLEFSATGADNIEIDISPGGIVSIAPNPDYNGVDLIKFTASDGGYSVESNVVQVNVANIREVPHFNELNCNLNIQEDSTGNNCILSATDFENDPITFSSRDAQNIVCEISGNVLTYTPLPDFSGPAICLIVAADIDGEDSKLLEFQVSPINDAPVLVEQIPEINLSEDEEYTDYLNLNEYFGDVDSALEFSVTGNSNIGVSIENGIVSFTLPPNYFGTELLVFHASDGEFAADSNSVTLNVNDVGDAPVFSYLNCETTLIEDQEYECELNATDAENDSFAFSVSEEDNLECEISGNSLIYKSKLDYFGTASCELKVEDNDGADFATLIVHINNVNDAPTIKTSSPEAGTIRVLENTEKIFSIEALDSDSQPTISWFLNGAQEKIERNKKSSFKLNKASGVYLLEALVSDSEFTTSRLWNVVFGPTKDFTCSEVGGYICTGSKICPGAKIDVKDTNICCSVECTPDFKKADSCEVFSPNITVSIKTPKNDDKVLLGSDQKIEIEITNTLSEDGDYNVEAHLYNLDKDRSEGDVETETTLESDRRKILRLDMPIPYDLNEDNNYAIYARVDGDECNQAYLPITIERSDNKLVISQFDLPQSLSCGDIVVGKIIIENIGNDDQDAKLKILNRQLGLSIDDNFLIQSSGDDNDKIVRSFSFVVPEKLESGDYEIRPELTYGIKRESLTSKIKVICNKPESSEEILDTTIKNTPEELEQETLSLNNVRRIAITKSSRISIPSIAAIAQILVIDLLLLGAILLLHAANVKRKANQEQNSIKFQDKKAKSRAK